MTRFTTKLETADVVLAVIQTEKRSKYIAVKTERLKTIISDTDWIQLVRKVVEPIREKIIEAHCMKKPHMSDLEPVPYQKLKFLITFLCLGKPEVGNVRLQLETICQLIVFNSKQFTRTNRTRDAQSVVRVRHSRAL